MSVIVLDKSYLDAASPSQIASLCTSCHLLMPDVLFYELTTTRKESMKRCFNKFPDRKNPVELIPNIGTLLQYELNTHKACNPLYERRINIIFEFNRGLGAGTYKWTAKQRLARDEREKHIEDKSRDFFELAMLVHEFFPHLNGLLFNDFSQAIEDIKKEVASSEDKVRQIYRRLLEYDAPLNAVEANVLTPNWAYFRWLQIRVIYSLDLLLRYQGKLPREISAKFWRRIEHEMLDAEYATLATLADGLACNETKIIEVYRLVCPNGLVFSC